MQKLVTLSFAAFHGFGGEKITHGEVQEHLAEYLSDGWRVASMMSVGSTGDVAVTAGWLAVLLEKHAAN